MIYFTAPYEDRKRIAELGAEWDFSHWAWKVSSPDDYAKFSRWISGTTIASEIYFLVAKALCPKCLKPVDLVALAVGEYTENFGREKKGAGQINILYGLENLSEDLSDYLAKKYSLKRRYLAAVGSKIRVNGCPHCDLIIPDEYLFIEPSSPFFIDSPERADVLDVSCLRLGCDYSFDAIVTRSVDKSFFRKEFRSVEDLKLF